MFDLTSGKLLLLGIVALIVLGPKDFPILLRTIGKYMGIIKKQADEFRAQFDEAMRESELDQIKKDVEGLGQDLSKSMAETQQSISSDLSTVTKDFDDIKTGIEANLNDPLRPSPHTTGYTPEEIREGSPGGSAANTVAAVGMDPDAHDANGIPMKQVAEVAPSTTVAPASAEPAAPVHGDRASLNGSGGHGASPATESSPKSGA
jgi:sec-independent protein translocase protein TatB